MSKRNFSWKRFFLRFVIIIFVVIVLVIIIVSPVAKHLIKKYGSEYTGRKVEMGSVYINPFTGKASIRKLIVYEANGDSAFIEIGRFSIGVSLLKLLRHTIDIRSLRIDNPYISISRRDTTFNFSDIMQKFKGKKPASSKAPSHINIRNIRLNNGEVRFTENKPPLSIAIRKIYFSSPGKFWDRDSLNGSFSLIPVDGTMKGDFMVEPDKKNIRLNLEIKEIHAEYFKQFISALNRNAFLNAGINLTLRLKGNFSDPLSMKTSGRLMLTNMHFGNPGQDFFSFDTFLVKLDTINLKNHKFFVDSVYLSRPNILYERFDTLDNFRRIISLPAKPKKPDTINILSKILNSDYRINRLLLKSGKIEFNDYSLSQEFHMMIDRFNIRSDSVNTEKKRVKIDISSKIHPAGTFTADFGIDPKNQNNFEFSYKFADIPAPMFNPYIINYTSHQLESGKIEFSGTWNIINNTLQSSNHFILVDPKDIQEPRPKGVKQAPLPLIMAFVRDNSSVVDYQIPVTGRINDPKFNLSDVITSVLKNIFVKPPLTPLRQHVKNVENEIEKTLTIRWLMRVSKPSDDQVKFIKKIRDFLKSSPEAHITLTPHIFAEKEKENIALFEAKKKYLFGNIHGKLPERDSMKIEQFSEKKDSSFNRFLKNTVKDRSLITFQSRCYRLAGPELIERKFRELENERKENVMKYFSENRTDNQVDFLDAVFEQPVNWFSYFLINYKGAVPESLREAFSKLYQINSEPPRRKYQIFRRR